MAALTLVLAAGGLAATSLLVTHGSQEPAPTADATVIVCRDLPKVSAYSYGVMRCAPRTQVAVPGTADEP